MDKFCTFGIILLLFSEILIGSSNINKFYFGKQSFDGFPVKRLTEFSLKLSKMLMLNA